MWVVSAFVVLWFSVSPGLAARDPVSAAEVARLAEEIDSLAQRQVWKGVERKFKEMEAIGAPIPEDAYLNGAYAARELGDMQATFDRLRSAMEIKPTKEIEDWVQAIDQHYGHVTLVTVPSRGSEFAPAEMPFDPTQRKCVEAAMEKVSETGKFDGLLPEGDYEFTGQTFRVEAGITIHIEVSPRMRRQGLNEPLIRYPDGQPPTSAQ